MANFLWNTNSPDQRISTPHTIYSFVIKAATLDGAPHPKLVLNATLNSHTRISFGRDGQKFPSVNVSVWRVNYCCCLSFRALLNTHSLLINVLLSVDVWVLDGSTSVSQYSETVFASFTQSMMIMWSKQSFRTQNYCKLKRKKHTFKLKFN